MKENIPAAFCNLGFIIASQLSFDHILSGLDA